MKDGEDRKEQRWTGGNRGVHLAGLKLARQQQGLTQRELAARSQTGPQTICLLENLRRTAYPVTLRKLSAALGVAPEELMRERPL